jgi:hypothetical protein
MVAQKVERKRDIRVERKPSLEYTRNKEILSFFGKQMLKEITWCQASVIR